MKSVTIHTDGACRGNPGIGGWGALLSSGSHQRELFGAALETTNNRMELTAAIKGLEALNQHCRVTLVTDSQYVRRGITEWLKQWKLKGWKTSSRKPVKNKDLWQRLDDLASQHTVKWKWVKGHAGHSGNEHADALANRAIDEYLEKQDD
jgi:ribonuclease HI|tara:strand:- start:1211 stop:1660 length:450 start_codon:yes stop_codon:yes gene_type:complete